MCVLNRAKTKREAKFNWNTQKIADEFSERTLFAGKGSMNIYDVWTKKDIGKTDKVYKTMIPGHDVKLLRLSSRK